MIKYFYIDQTMMEKDPLREGGIYLSGVSKEKSYFRNFFFFIINQRIILKNYYTYNCAYTKHFLFTVQKNGRIIKWTPYVGFLTLAGMARVVERNHG